MRRRVCVGLLPVLAFAVYACVSDNNNNIVGNLGDGGESDQDGAGGTQQDGSVTPGQDATTADVKDASTADVFPTCDDAEVLCGHTCALLASSGGNCGRCGHDCGGGMCTFGQCGSTTVVSAIQELGGYDVDTGYVYYSTNNANASTAAVSRCAVTGCAPAMQVFSTNTLGANVGTVKASAGAVAFVFTKVSAAEIAQVCPETGCTAAGTVAASGNQSELFGAVGETFFSAGGPVNSNIQVGACSDAGLACTRYNIGQGKTVAAAAAGPDVIYSTTAGTAVMYAQYADASVTTTLLNTVPDQTAMLNGIVYTLKTGPVGANSGIIGKCAVTGCGGASSTLIGPLSYPSEMAVDATGIYWIAPSIDQIMTCPLAGCPGTGPIVVTKVLGANPAKIRLDAGFVYWTQDSPNDAGIAASNIVRVAKP